MSSFNRTRLLSHCSTYIPNLLYVSEAQPLIYPIRNLIMSFQFWISGSFVADALVAGSMLWIVRYQSTWKR